jgi:hypothetical protein
MDAEGRATQEAKAEIIFRGGNPHRIKATFGPQKYLAAGSKEVNWFDAESIRKRKSPPSLGSDPGGLCHEAAK